MKDIYFDPNYGKLYEKIEDGICEVYKFNCSIGTIQHMFIKREIPTSINNETYYDLTTPYGYGGPIILNCEKGYENELVKEFENEFQKYCFKNNIVSEFIRFHPIINNAEDFINCYDVRYIRDTIGTNLSDFKDPFQEEFSKSCRYNVRKALKDGVSYNIIEKPRDLGDFKEIYYSTMRRNNADSYYFFDDEYFNNCLELFRDNLVLIEATYNKTPIAMGMYFTYNKYIHVHLSGTLYGFLKLKPAYVLRYAITAWGKENGYELIHHGGGRSNSQDDGLYKFKKQFGENTKFKFKIGEKVWNREMYNKLCKTKGIVNGVDFFPAYRA